MMQELEGGWLNVQEASQFSGVSKTRIGQLSRHGLGGAEEPVIRRRQFHPGGPWYYSTEDLERYVEGRREQLHRGGRKLAVLGGPPGASPARAARPKVSKRGGEAEANLLNLLGDIELFAVKFRKAMHAYVAEVYANALDQAKQASQDQAKKTIGKAMAQLSRQFGLQE